MNSQWKG